MWAEWRWHCQHWWRSRRERKTASGDLSAVKRKMCIGYTKIQSVQKICCTCTLTRCQWNTRHHRYVSMVTDHIRPLHCDFWKDFLRHVMICSCVCFYIYNLVYWTIQYCYIQMAMPRVCVMYLDNVRSYLTTGLDCGLDCWRWLMDWITGLAIELNFFVSLVYLKVWLYVYTAKTLGLVNSLGCHRYISVTIIQGLECK